jgi:putative tryptophan/tyrosine transport system substrate-binding protein
MRRREFIAAIGAVALSPSVARSQQAIRRIGTLFGFSRTDPEVPHRIATFRDALASLGWKQGENIQIEHRWAEGDPGRVKEEAAALVKVAPDLVIGNGTLVAQALRDASPTTPVIFTNVVDPIQSGLVSSLARPGGRVTGFTNYEASMAGKWLEILRDIAPRITRVIVLANPSNPMNDRLLKSLAPLAARLDITLLQVPSDNKADIGHGIDALQPSETTGFLALPDFTTSAHRDLIIDRANRARSPGVYPFRSFAAAGGLAAYGIDQTDMIRNAAGYADRILRGAAAGTLPVQTPTKFELVFNLKTARAIGLSLPPSLLARADEVIE